MAINRKDIIAEQAQKYDSFYLYDERCIIERVNSLQSNFPLVDFLYSIKCNPNPHVLRSIRRQGLGADAASLGEVRAARAAGFPGDQIYYSAPGKTQADIEGALAEAVLIADSTDEIRRIQAAAERRGTVVSIGVRINPDFSFYEGRGCPSKFGIDAEQAVDFIQNNTCKNIKITGIHVHLKSQERQADVLAGYYRRMLQLAEQFYHLCGGLAYVNMGSGIGVQYSAGDEHLDLALLRSSVEGALDRFRARHPETRLIIEVGRYAVCNSGVYVTRVLDRKTSYGKTYLILKNTLNGFLRPSLARLAADHPPANAEPLFTTPNAFSFLTLKDGGPAERVTLAGNLCTAADTIAEDIVMPRLECGDCVIITNAGSYAAALSPMQFSTQDRPAELFLTADGEVLEGGQDG